MMIADFIQEPIQAKWRTEPTMNRSSRQNLVLEATSPEGIYIEWYAGMVDGMGYQSDNLGRLATEVWFLTNINRTDLPEGPRFISYDFAKQIAAALIKRMFKSTAS